MKPTKPPFRVEYLLFDMDNTLYPASSGLLREINQRMTRFTAELLDVSEEEAYRRRMERGQKYGTTIEWLIGEAGLEDPHSFFEAVHPKDVSGYINYSPELKKMLRSLPYPKSVLTNSPGAHAENVLHFLGIKEEFEFVFDITSGTMQGKPAVKTYRMVLEKIGQPAHAVLFMDDVAHYLLPFQEMGGQVLWINEEGDPSHPDIPQIGSVIELPSFLKKTGK